jgi:hypothetical protein
MLNPVGFVFQSLFIVGSLLCPISLWFIQSHVELYAPCVSCLHLYCLSAIGGNIEIPPSQCPHKKYQFIPIPLPIRQMPYWPVTVARGISAPEYWSVLSPLLGENEGMHFSDSPLYVASSPRASVGVSYLRAWDFKMCFALTAVDSLISNPVSGKSVLMDTPAHRW